MYHNKLKDQVCPLTKPPWYFCLGDVSLNNILFDGKQFTLLDFECAHMGYLGFLIQMSYQKSLYGQIDLNDIISYRKALKKKAFLV